MRGLLHQFTATFGRCTSPLRARTSPYRRFGRWHRTARQGCHSRFHLLKPFSSEPRETTIPIHPQTRITRTMHVQLGGAVYTKVDNTYNASYGIEDPEMAITVLAQSAMRKELVTLELDQLFSRREAQYGIAEALDQATQPWGVRVFEYEIADIHVDRTRSYGEAEQRRAPARWVLESEGCRRS